MRLVFAGTPQVAADTLARLISDPAHEVVAVLTRPDAPQGRSSRLVPSPVAELALAHGIEVLRPERATDPALAERIAQLAPDCCPVVAYGALLPSSLLRLPAHGWVNVHYSLLPRWRGAAPVQRAILAGDRTTGVTVQEVVKELDAGPVLAVREYQLGELETAGEALAALTGIGADALVATLAAIATGTAVATPQPDHGITLASKLTVAEARIDWARPAVELDRQIRANNPSPVAWAELDGERFRVLLARPHDGSGLWAGQVRVEKRRVVVGTGDGDLELLRVQPSGRKTLAGADWGRGLRAPAVLT